MMILLPVHTGLGKRKRQIQIYEKGDLKVAKTELVALVLKILN